MGTPSSAPKPGAREMRPTAAQRVRGPRYQTGNATQNLLSPERRDSRAQETLPPPEPLLSSRMPNKRTPSWYTNRRLAVPNQYDPLTARSTRPRTLAGMSSSIAEFIALYSPPGCGLSVKSASKAQRKPRSRNRTKPSASDEAHHSKSIELPTERAQARRHAVHAVVHVSHHPGVS